MPLPDAKSLWTTPSSIRSHMASPPGRRQPPVIQTPPSLGASESMQRSPFAGNIVTGSSRASPPLDFSQHTRFANEDASGPKSHLPLTPRRGQPTSAAAAAEGKAAGVSGVSTARDGGADNQKQSEQQPGEQRHHKDSRQSGNAESQPTPPFALNKDTPAVGQQASIKPRHAEEPQPSLEPVISLPPPPTDLPLPPSSVQRTHSTGAKEDGGQTQSLSSLLESFPSSGGEAETPSGPKGSAPLPTGDVKAASELEQASARGASWNRTEFDSRGPSAAQFSFPIEHQGPQQQQQRHRYQQEKKGKRWKANAQQEPHHYSHQQLRGQEPMGSMEQKETQADARHPELALGTPALFPAGRSGEAQGGERGGGVEEGEAEEGEFIPPRLQELRQRNRAMMQAMEGAAVGGATGPGAATGGAAGGWGDRRDSRRGGGSRQGQWRKGGAQGGTGGSAGAGALGSGWPLDSSLQPGPRSLPHAGLHAGVPGAHMGAHSGLHAGGYADGALAQRGPRGGPQVHLLSSAGGAWAAGPERGPPVGGLTGGVGSWVGGPGAERGAQRRGKGTHSLTRMLPPPVWKTPLAAGDEPGAMYRQQKMRSGARRTGANSVALGVPGLAQGGAPAYPALSGGGAGGGKAGRGGRKRKRRPGMDDRVGAAGAGAGGGALGASASGMRDRDRERERDRDRDDWQQKKRRRKGRNRHSNKRGKGTAEGQVPNAGDGTGRNTGNAVVYPRPGSVRYAPGSLRYTPGARSTPQEGTHGQGAEGEGRVLAPWDSTSPMPPWGTPGSDQQIGDVMEQLQVNPYGSMNGILRLDVVPYSGSSSGGSGASSSGSQGSSGGESGGGGNSNASSESWGYAGEAAGVDGGGDAEERGEDEIERGEEGIAVRGARQAAGGLAEVEGDEEEEEEGAGLLPFPGSLGGQGGGAGAPGIFLPGEGEPEAEQQAHAQGQRQGPARASSSDMAAGAVAGGALKGHAAGDAATSPSSSVGDDYGRRQQAEGGAQAKPEREAGMTRRDQQQRQQGGEAPKGEKTHRHHRRRAKPHALPEQDNDSEWLPLPNAAQHRRQRQRYNLALLSPHLRPGGLAPLGIPPGGHPFNIPGASPVAGRLGGLGVGQGLGADSFMRTRIDEQDMQIARLEEENLTLRERLFVKEQELSELRRRVAGLHGWGSGPEEEEGMMRLMEAEADNSLGAGVLGDGGGSGGGSGRALESQGGYASVGGAHSSGAGAHGSGPQASASVGVAAAVTAMRAGLRPGAGAGGVVVGSAPAAHGRPGRPLVLEDSEMAEGSCAGAGGVGGERVEEEGDDEVQGRRRDVPAEDEEKALQRVESEAEKSIHRVGSEAEEASGTAKDEAKRDSESPVANPAQACPA